MNWMHTDDPVVSYVLTTKNRATFLERALESMTQYVTPMDEVIVVDGGSTDHTESVVRRFRSLVTSYVSEPDHGEAHGFNKALLMARGEFIKLVTDDDVIFADGMSLVVETLSRHPEVDAVICGGELNLVRSDGDEPTTIGYQYLPTNLSLQGDPLNFFHFTPCGVGLVLRRRILPVVGLLDTTFTEVDSDLLFRLHRCAVELRYLNVKLFRHTDYPHSGQRQSRECVVDRLRLLARSGLWDRLLDEHRYPKASIMAVMGLDRLPFGNSLFDLVLEGERLRRSRFAFLLPPITWSARVIGAVGRRVFSPFRRRQAALRPVQEEPHWDASMR